MQKIAIVDYGNQFTHLVATEIRRLNVYSEIVDSSITASQLAQAGYIGLILSQGSSSSELSLNQDFLDLNIPILALDHNHQLFLGHSSSSATETPKYHKATLKVNSSEGLLAGFSENTETQVWIPTSQQSGQNSLPTGFKVLASNSAHSLAAIGKPDQNLFSIQFHPEITHTQEGQKILKNFLNLCKADFSWNLSTFLEQLIQEIKEQVNNKKVFLLISGGVDSTVTFALLNKAIGADNVYGLFVDTGFLRKNEVDQVTTALKSIGVNNLHVYDGAQKYFDALQGVFEPEEKRTIIGNLFLDIQQEVSDSLNLNPDEWILGQGTIYPDTIESGNTKNAQKIKTHHNRVEKIEELIKKGKIIEPVKDLYKDEVRQIGALLGLPKEMIQRHPFPGPGLAVRTLCSSTSAIQKLPSQLEQAQSDINSFLQTSEIAQNLSSEFLHGHILNIKSVGTQGDGRTYRHPLILETTLSTIQENFNNLLELSTALTNNFSDINRVILKISDLNSKITNIEVSPGKYLRPERLQILKEADNLFTKIIKESGEYQLVWQSPVILVPINIATQSSNSTHEESLIIRPITSREAMTADVFALNLKTITSFTEEARNLPLSAIFYDLTHKPPGTIEWE